MDEILAPGSTTSLDKDPDPLKIRRPRIWELYGQLMIQQLAGQGHTSLSIVCQLQQPKKEKIISSIEPENVGCLGKFLAIFGIKPKAIEIVTEETKPTDSAKLPSNDSIALLANAIAANGGNPAGCSINQAQNAVQLVASYVLPKHLLNFAQGTSNLLITELGWTKIDVENCLTTLRQSVADYGASSEPLGVLPYDSEWLKVIDIIALVSIRLAS